MATVLLAMAGLVVDGGLALNARQKVTDDVEQAARAGSLHLDLAELRDDNLVRIDPDDAADAAAKFLGGRGYTAGQVEIQADAQQITVTATVVRPTALLSLIGVNSFTVRASGQARPSVGINNGALP